MKARLFDLSTGDTLNTIEIPDDIYADRGYQLLLWAITCDVPVLAGAQAVRTVGDGCRDDVTIETFDGRRIGVERAPTLARVEGMEAKTH